VAQPGFIDGAPLRPGQLTLGWQMMLAACWTAAFFAFAAVWKTSQEIGIGTWWLGARAQPQPIAVRITPFALTLAVGMVALYNIRRSAWISAAASVAIAVCAAFDMSRSGGLAATEFAIAGSMLLVSIGAALGAIRRNPFS
jgi:hypothetical protein